MSVFKCKMCGGTIEFEQGATVGVCDSCGTKQTLPRLDDDRKANLYDRANHFRRNNDFDKAMSIYEQILNEDNTDAEAYWSLVLCRYGIEYVEDPASHKRIPTVNRAQFTSIFADEDYKSALQYADGYQKTIYEDEAKAIDEIQKGILAISQKEEPFDVFICYKETDANGRRTQDSVLANDLYHQLTQEGFKVFFARITLEDKLGTAYEPYIFAALNSSKVMVVLGTKPEYFNAVWVKNEWSRYLALIKNGSKKMLIPAYRDMDPYDLPEEFSHLQAQDMSKLGFMQDLIRGIKKIIEADAPKQTVKETVIVGANNAATTPLLERVSLFLEDGKWQDANIYCEKVLDIDPKNAEAYLGKLMVELQVRNRKQLADCAEPFDDRDNYSKVLRFGDEALEKEMRGYITHINERNENTRLTGIYNSAKNAMSAANTESAFKTAADTFATIPGFKDADTLAEQCLEKAEICRKDAVYSTAKSKMIGEKVASYEEAINVFRTISGWKDSDEQIYACQKKIEEIKAKEEADRLEVERKAEERRIAAEKAAKKRKKAFAIGTPIVAACIAFVIVLTTVIIPTAKYNRAVEKYGKEWADTVKNASVGDTITFGAYEQDNNTSNGKEAIEWTVLDKDGMSLLLISKQALDCQQYNTSYTDVTWESCSLRKWMNGTFLNKAFNAEEQAQIQNTTVSADKNPEYNTNPGNATTDKVFLLSINEVEKYFNSDEARKCAPTAYAKAQGAYTSDIYKTASGAATCWWWLRSPGTGQSLAAYVSNGGSVSCSGYTVNYDFDAVRPALWINLDS
jgi:tetratricopeptide (TPR) repeat protein